MEEKTNFLLFDPELATRIGLNEAIVIHQIEYWLDKYKDDPTHMKDGKVWVYNTYEDWQAQFPFWSFHTIRNIFGKMLDKGYLIRGNYNRLSIDRTYWYTINYENINSEVPECGTSKCQDVADGSANMWHTNTIDYTETTKPKTTVSTVSSFDKQKDDDTSDTFIEKTLPAMLTKIYIQKDKLHMPYNDCLSLVNRFLSIRPYYATDEYKLTAETLLKAVNGIEQFYRYMESYDYELKVQDFHLMMDAFFESKSNSLKHSGFTLNQFCHPNMLLGIYGDVFSIRELSWEGNGEIMDVVNA